MSEIEFNVISNSC